MNDEYPANVYKWYDDQGTDTTPYYPKSNEVDAEQLIRELQQFLQHGPGTVVQKYTAIEAKLLTFHAN